MRSPALTHSQLVSVVAAVSAATRAANAVTGAVGLRAQRIDVQQVNADATLAVATVATRTTIAAAGHEQGQDSTRGEQLHVLAVDVSKAQSVRHSSPPHSGPKGPETGHLIDRNRRFGLFQPWPGERAVTTYIQHLKFSTPLPSLTMACR